MTGNIFVSYRRDDTAVVRAGAFFGLEGSFPLKDCSWMSTASRRGKTLPGCIEKQVRACDAMLVLIGPDWLTVHEKRGAATSR